MQLSAKIINNYIVLWYTIRGGYEYDKESRTKKQRHLFK